MFFFFFFFWAKLKKLYWDKCHYALFYGIKTFVLVTNVSFDKFQIAFAFFNKANPPYPVIFWLINMVFILPSHFSLIISHLLAEMLITRLSSRVTRHLIPLLFIPFLLGKSWWPSPAFRTKCQYSLAYWECFTKLYQSYRPKLRPLFCIFAENIRWAPRHIYLKKLCSPVLSQSLSLSLFINRLPGTLRIQLFHFFWWVYWGSIVGKA